MAYSKIKLRRGTAYDWNSLNPVLEEGEIVVECPDAGVGTGLSKFKIGDGSTPYSSLPYAFDGMRASSIDGGGAEKFNIIQIRGAKAATWESVNPILNSRELGFDMTHMSIKVGNGKNPWNELPFIKASDFTGEIIDCGDEENPETEEEVEYEEDYNQSDDPTPSDPDAPDNPDDPTPDPDPEPTPTEGETLSIVNNADGTEITSVVTNNVRIYTISEGGTYEIAMPEGVTSADNTRIIVSTLDTVRLNLQDITINNTALNDDTPVIISSSANNTNIYVYGDCYIAGNSTYLVAPANGVIVSQGTGDLFFYGTGNLTVTDPMDSTADYSEVGMSSAVYSNGAVGNYANLRLVANGYGLRANGNVADYQGNINITSRHSNGIEATGNVSFDASHVTISAAEGIGINATGDFVAEGYTEVAITVGDVANGIIAASQNISDFATVTIEAPEETEDESADMEP